MTDLANRIGEELAFGAAAGAMLVVGEAPRSIVMGAAASATVVALVGDHEAVAADLEALLPPPIVVVDDAASIPDGCYGAAVLWEPPGDATSTLERVLAVVADAGLPLAGVRGRAHALLMFLLLTTALPTLNRDQWTRDERSFFHQMKTPFPVTVVSVDFIFSISVFS